MILRFPGKIPHKSSSFGKSQNTLVYSQRDLQRLDIQITEEQIQIEQDSRKTSERAHRIIGTREHSAQELTRKLLARGHVEKLVLHVVGEMKEQGLISDRRFAESFVRNRIAKGYGPIFICGELRERGVSERILEDVVTHPGDFWLELAQASRDKRFGSPDTNAPLGLTGAETEVAVNPDNKKLLAQAYWAKQARFLSRRGFPADLIYRVLERS